MKRTPIELECAELQDLSAQNALVARMLRDRGNCALATTAQERSREYFDYAATILTWLLYGKWT
jgi:hypothetical protein